MPENDELHLENAPIVEAVIAIDVNPPLGDESMTALEAALQGIRSGYPGVEPLRQVQLQFGFGPGMVPIGPHQQDAAYGWKYVSGDKRQLAVFRRNGFAFSRLPPYQRWATFRDEALRLWKVYRSVADAIPIVRFGLRYINRLNIEFGRPIDHFLNLYPEIPANPDGSLRTINSSYMRVDSMLTEIPAGRLIIQQATLPPARTNAATISLDFDISVTPEPTTDEEFVWRTLDVARRVKNELFVSSLKPEFLETFR